ncbi:hypothetical protein LTR56_001398 [Elasticomyces elasticus]|nr:hypothetical protein LTR56_001398 [Elasticomyces elasticus]KAK3668679.1 hypothetical protein LTR22_000566 [Elasticomyces elasticus]KAK4932031.1 hypothetical protein LTR49_001718 [Elasticomyces elasticus]KAK5768438.1 hypothetical protein LTS12_001226 [Elasticomyces elasticus]
MSPDTWAQIGAGGMFCGVGVTAAVWVGGGFPHVALALERNVGVVRTRGRRVVLLCNQIPAVVQGTFRQPDLVYELMSRMETGVGGSPIVDSEAVPVRVPVHAPQLAPLISNAYHAAALPNNEPGPRGARVAMSNDAQSGPTFPAMAYVPSSRVV